jgi:hypothetical protein
VIAMDLALSFVIGVIVGAAAVIVAMGDELCP